MPITVPSTAARHLINRFSYGYTPGMVEAVDGASGGPMGWFRAQLAHTAVADTQADAMRAWFRYLGDSALIRQTADHEGRRSQWEQSMDFVRWTILRRIHSQRQLFECMVDFCSNLVHVPASFDGWMYRTGYDLVIRQNALGKFSDLLVDASMSAAMQVFLDGHRSTRTAVIENHGRELLELHTVGAGAGYSEQEVLSSARILTGYNVEVWLPAAQTYVPDRHWTGPVSVLGFSATNASPDGRAVMRSYLRYLASHPLTAERVARRLCQRFVSDAPSADLVRTVTKAYTDSGTDLKACLIAVISHPEFWSSVDAKTRTPAQDAIATYRALGVTATPPTGDSDFGLGVNYVLNDMGEAPYHWPAPNGFPETSAPWASAGRLRNSWDMHNFTTGGWWPSTGMTRKSPKELLPTGTMPLITMVDAVSRSLLGRPVTLAQVQAAAAVLTFDITTPVDRDTLGDYLATPLIAAVLNSPEHLRR